MTRKDKRELGGGSGKNKNEMKTKKTKKFITICSKEKKRRITVQCQAMFGSFLAPSSTVWADESQERTKILLVIILHLQLFHASLVIIVIDC